MAPDPRRVAILGVGKIGESLLGGLLDSDQTVLSVAAAIPTAAIERRIPPGVPVVRAMPNAPATVHEGIAGVCAGANAGVRAAFLNAIQAAMERSAELAAGAP